MSFRLRPFGAGGGAEDRPGLLGRSAANLSEIAGTLRGSMAIQPPA
jgi:hypothetical protein